MFIKDESIKCFFLYRFGRALHSSVVKKQNKQQQQKLLQILFKSYQVNLFNKPYSGKINFILEVFCNTKKPFWPYKVTCFRPNKQLQYIHRLIKKPHINCMNILFRTSERKLRIYGAFKSYFCIKQSYCHFLFLIIVCKSSWFGAFFAWSTLLIDNGKRFESMGDVVFTIYTLKLAIMWTALKALRHFGNYGNWTLRLLAETRASN